MNNIAGKIPTNFILGLATVASTTTVFSSGDVSATYELAHHKMDFKPKYKAKLYNHNFNVKNLTSIYNKQTRDFIGANKGLSTFLDQSILELQEYFNVFSHSVSIFEDPNEGYSQLQITIYSMDEDKIDKYCEFLDYWSEKVPRSLTGVIAYEIG